MIPVSNWRACCVVIFPSCTFVDTHSSFVLHHTFCRDHGNRRDGEVLATCTEAAVTGDVCCSGYTP